MRDNWIASDSHVCWVRAFFWWYRNGGDQSQIDALTKEGVLPCGPDALFLANIKGRDAEDRKLIRPRGSRSQGLDIFIETIIDNEVAALRKEGADFKLVALELGRRWDRKFTANALRQRAHRMKRKPRVDSITAFSRLYLKFSRERYF